MDEAWRVGDEPLLLAEVAPTVVSRDRPAGARLIEALGADIIVMDDGFQNPSLKKDFSLIVVDAGAGIGSGRIFPLGPLRAPLGFQAGMADAILILGEDPAGESLQRVNASLRGRYPSPQPSPARGEGAGRVRCKGVPSLPQASLDELAIPRSSKRMRTGEGQDEGVRFCRGLNAFEAKIVPRITDDDMRGLRFLAFCGIGRPAKFFETLRQAGVAAIRTRSFPDHHAYSETDALSLLGEANALGAGLITTGKDLVRLRHKSGALGELGRSTLALPVTVEFADGHEAL